MIRLRFARPFLCVALTAACASVAHAADRAKGSVVEVREGDSWSKATILATEGRRVHVKYDDGTEEWVGPDRVRDVGASAPTPDATPPARGFTKGQAVEVKHHGKWNAATLQQVAPNWLFVIDDGERGEKRWAESWAVRVPGSAYDIDGGGSNSWAANVGDPAPGKPPIKSPPAFGNPFAAAPTSQRSYTADDLEHGAEKLSYDGTREPAPAGAGRVVALPTTRPAAEFSGWPLRGVDQRFDRILPCPNSLNVAVATFPGAFGHWTSIVRTNLLGHAQMDTRVIRTNDLKVVAAADNGDLLLTTQGWATRIQLWRWEAGSYRLVSNVAFDSDRASVVDAQLLAADRAIVALSDGAVMLLDPAGKRTICSTAGAKEARAFSHPSGKLTGVITSAGTAVVLRSDDFATLAEFPDAAGTSNVAIDPTGTVAAYVAKSGAARVVNIADGSTLGSVRVGAAFKGRLDLVDDRFLVADSSVAYDIKTGVPAWTYTMRPNASVAPLANGQFAIGVSRDKTVALAVASIPDAAGRAAARAIDLKQFVLVPGTAVKVDADFNAFGAEKEKAAIAIGEAIGAAGLKQSDADQPFHLSLTSAGGPSEPRDYAPGDFTPPPRIVTTVNVTSTIVTATLTFNGRALWSQELKFAAGSLLESNATHSFQQSADEAAKPKADALRTLAVPAYLRGDAKPGEPASLGASTFDEHKFIPASHAAAKP